MIRAVIFDLDGVLINTDEYHFRSWVELAREEGVPFDRATYDAHMRGVGRMQALEAWLAGSTRTYSEAEKQALAERKNRCFLELVQRRPPEPAEGAIELLRELRRRGAKIAIASSSKNAREITRLSGFETMVDALTDGHIEPSKPDPEVFLCAARKLGVPPSQCIVVEDSPYGVEAARRAGMPVVAVGPAERFQLPPFRTRGAGGWQVTWNEPTLAALTAERLLEGFRRVSQ